MPRLPSALLVIGSICNGSVRIDLCCLSVVVEEFPTADEIRPRPPFFVGQPESVATHDEVGCEDHVEMIMKRHELDELFSKLMVRKIPASRGAHPFGDGAKNFISASTES